MSRIIYKYRGQDLAAINIVVKASAGIVDLPQIKERKSYDWDSMDGKVTDQEAEAFFEARTITLECAMQGDDPEQFLANIEVLRDLLMNPGLGMLEVILPQMPDRPLAFFVYPTAGLQIAKQWTQTQVLGTFSLQFEEPEPIKTTLKMIDVTKPVSFRLSTRGGVIYHIYANGESRQYSTEEADTITITASGSATGYVMISGRHNGINNLTNAITLWNS